MRQMANKSNPIQPSSENSRLSELARRHRLEPQKEEAGSKLFKLLAENGRLTPEESGYWVTAEILADMFSDKDQAAELVSFNGEDTTVGELKRRIIFGQEHGYDTEQDNLFQTAESFINHMNADTQLGAFLRQTLLIYRWLKERAGDGSV